MKKTFLILFMTLLIIGTYTYKEDIKNIYYKVIKETKPKVYFVSNNHQEILNLQEDNSYLKEILELNKTISDKKHINATVIDRNTSYWNDQIIVDKGKKDGIKKDKPVIVKNGLIGYVLNTTKNTSTIKLLTTQNYINKISIKINNTFGLITEYDKKNNQYIIEELSNNEEIKVGDIVYTSGYSTKYPPNIEIGIVNEIEYDNFELDKILKVKPSINFNKIPYVTILLW